MIFENGSYGERLATISKRAGIQTNVTSSLQSDKITESTVERALQSHPDITAIAVVHCETSSGIINPVENIIKTAKRILPGMFNRLL